MSLAALAGVESVDRERREATVLAGTKLAELGPVLREAGLAMETLPDIDRQEIAGAIATGTHGTGRRIGPTDVQQDSEHYEDEEKLASPGRSSTAPSRRTTSP